ncbi:GNAT family N-acetyltransferase [Flavobacterium silvaticum]|uniref:GNAT family N-acetyltransferase n=1 Tax=Flavobacterium silvaticum TaxID=1852020 RepID=A0A972FKV6_9FLAO|nr:GNAT family N-acetyltransferase [Flavobacterium silvaticum]NMH27826.1 GNAT family N-acetyltransferase [Flavobacterium silvaticum]
MEISIRKVASDDFEIVYNLINLLENQVMDKNRQLDIFNRNLGNPQIIYLLAFLDSEAVGFLSCHAQYLLHHSGLIGEIQELVVSENARSLGIGKLLIENLIPIARKMKIEQLEVTSSFKREAAHRFYEREGFVHSHKKFTLPI